MSASSVSTDFTEQERRSPPPAASDESWFGAFGPPEESRFADAPASPFTAPGDLDDGAAHAAQAAPDSRFLLRQAERLVSTGQTAFERIYRTFVGARAVLGVALVLTIGVSSAFGVRPNVAAIMLSVVYAALAIALWWLPAFRRATPPQALARLRSPQWLATIGTDLLCFTALPLLAAGSGLNYVALLVLPVLMAGVLTPRLLALATAGVATFALLGAAWLAVLAGGDAAQLMTQAGLAGAGLFVTTVLVGELAGRLAREELSARGNMEMARQQAQLNRLVIEEMQDGVLVVDRRGRVRAANPAARHLLAPSGMSRAAPFQLRGVEAWAALVKTVERAFVDAAWPEAGRDVTLAFEPGASRTLRVRIRFTRKRETQEAEEFCVLFLEDVRNMQARSRQEKLAAMGRVSAGIAHEIRNPLAAIAQANALLDEDAVHPGQRQLTRMVAENVERLKRIVDDVMEVAANDTPEQVVIDATAQVAAACGEWARAAGVRIGDSSVLRVELPAEPIGVVFDAEHLRRVLVNLLDNARRHASATPGAIVLRLDSRDDARAFLSVTSDGEPIAAEVERYLFEPFFSTRSRGTGLGLYICRELCERYGASIDYRLRPADERLLNEFYVVMRRKALSMSDARLHSLMTTASHFSLLVVDDEPDLRTLYELTLLREGYDIETAATVDDALAHLKDRTFSAVITDMRLPDGTGLDLLRRLEESGRREKAIVITAYGSAENAVEALKAGAYDYLTKPVDLKQFRAVVASALGRAPSLVPTMDPSTLPSESGAPAMPRAPRPVALPAAPESAALRRMAGQSGAMAQVRALVDKVARSMAPVLVSGESGTGKELVARSIHEVSVRGGQPFIAVNCGAIPEQLLEAEFFGYRKGAFTGAAEDREGFFQAASGGTLFLDEIGDLPIAMQSKLLRSIQERSVRPVGAVSEQPVNVRLLSATHKDLAAEVQAGRFRQDLYYRLNVIQICVPPLRERLEDLPGISERVLDRIAADAGVAPAPRLTREALALLSRYAFPGNVRELENLLHRAVALSGGETIDVADLGLPAALVGDTGAAPDDEVSEPVAEPLEALLPAAAPLPQDLAAYLDEVERDILVRALERHRFNRTAAGASMGLSLRQMRYRMARLGVNVGGDAPGSERD